MLPSVTMALHMKSMSHSGKQERVIGYFQIIFLPSTPFELVPYVPETEPGGFNYFHHQTLCSQVQISRFHRDIDNQQQVSAGSISFCPAFIVPRLNGHLTSKNKQK